MKHNKVLGIDIGGSGVKGAPVNTDDGLMLESRYRIPTPTPATPHNVAPLIAEMVKHFKWEGLEHAFPTDVFYEPNERVVCSCTTQRK